MQSNCNRSEYCHSFRKQFKCLLKRFIKFHGLLCANEALLVCRMEQLYQNVMSLWHQLHMNMKSVVSWHYLQKDISNISSWTLDTVTILNCSLLNLLPCRDC